MSSFVPIHGLHHFAYRCRDAEETRHFYEDLLGLPLIHVIRQDRVPSTQDYNPHAHIFFRMTDGSCIAFFDLGDDQKADPSPNTPGWVNHLALRVGSLDELEDARQRLIAGGIDVLGPTDHHFIKSIYFFDPNGIRLELTAPAIPASDPIHGKYARSAHEELAAWEREKRGKRAAAPGSFAQNH
jgi:glyoxylase I family protein